MFFILHGRFPGEKAAAVFAAKNAEAFADAGMAVTFLAPRRIGMAKKTPAEFYGIKNNFKMVYVPTIDLFFLPFLKRFAFVVSYVLFSKMVLMYLLLHAQKDDVIYSNEALPLLLASVRFPNTFYEVHDFPKETRFYRVLFSRIRLAIATNRWKQKKIAELFNMSAEKLLYAPNAVDFSKFEHADGTAIRQQYFGTKDAIVIGYVGALRTMGVEKGVGTLLQAMRVLGGAFEALIIGGDAADIAYYRKLAADRGVADRLIFTGWVKHDEVPHYLKACDILVAPFPADDHYRFYMSPMKLFEYMASGRPIVASDIASIREVVDETMVFFARPDDPRSLASTIQMVFTSSKEAKRRSENARRESRKYTWEARAEKIIETMRVVN